MSISEARSYTEIPPVAPVVGGVLSVARVITASAHDLLGTEYLTDACAFGGVWDDMCAFDATIGNCVPPPALSTGATAGTPGTWTPGGSTVPTRQNIISGQVTVTPNPATAWTEGQYVVTSDGVEGYWDGTAWMPGRAPAPPAGGSSAVLTSLTPNTAVDDGTIKNIAVIGSNFIDTGLTHFYVDGVQGSGTIEDATHGTLVINTALYAVGTHQITMVNHLTVPPYTPQPPSNALPFTLTATTVFDPASATIPEVQDHVNNLTLTGAALTAEIQRILDLERADKNRTTLVSWLDQFPGVV